MAVSKMLGAGLLLLIALAGLGVARAETSAPASAAEPRGPSALVDVSTHLARARQFFQDEKYREAADEMLAAYAVEGKPLYVFNAAQAYRKAQLYKEALTQYRAFVELVATGPLVNEAQGHIQDMEALIKEQGSRQEVHLLLESEQAEKKKTQDQLQSEQKKSQQMEQALSKERNKPFYKKTWFHGLIGATVSVVVTGTLIGLVLGSTAKTDAGTKSITF